jgi:hypothetical protein
METFINGAIIGITVLWLGMIGYTVVLTLKLKRPVTSVTGRIGSMVSKGKGIADTGRRELEQNKYRWQALTGEVKSLVDAVKPGVNATAPPRVQINYRTLLTAVSVLGTLRRGWAQLRTARNPAANPPGPAAAKKKAPPRRLGTLELLPDLIRIAREVRRQLH